MKVIALVSGGKDSCYNMVQCVAEGHQIVALANLKPPDKQNEIDSYMFQTVGYQAIDLYAQAMGLPLFRKTIEGSSVRTEKDYNITEGDEVEDLYKLLKSVLESVEADAVSVGAILSDYQRIRVENVCGRLGLTVLAYLWRRDQMDLLGEMIRAKTTSIIIKVAAMGLLPDKHLGLTLEEIYPMMVRLNEKYGLNICGEGGEYETFTLDCPLFQKRIVVDEFEKVIHSDDAFAPVGYLVLKSLHLEEKSSRPATADELINLRIQHSQLLIRELFNNEDLETLSKVIPTKEEGTYLEEELVPVINVTSPLIKESNGLFWISNLYGKGQTVVEASHYLLDSLLQSLSSLSAKINNVYAVNLYMKSMSDYEIVNPIYKSHFGTNPPIRICIEVNLPSNLFLMMDVSGSLENAGESRSTMHVQGVSHWAPANIGPYSQGVKLKGQIFVAGQIGLCPATMKLIDKGFIAEARLSLRHVRRILVAMNPKLSLKNTDSCICYLTQSDFIKIAIEEWNQGLDLDNSEDLLTISKPIVEFVVVPALPKNAMIEWQCRFSELHLGELNEHKTTIPKCDVHFQYWTIPENKSLILRATLLKIPSVDKKDISAFEIIPEFICSFDKILKDFDWNWKDVPLIRIFYRKDCFHPEELRSVFESCLQEHNSINPYTLVPVQRLTDISCILSLLL